MGPIGLSDEALQQLRRGDRTPEAPAGVLRVVKLVTDHFVVLGPERHAAYALAGALASLDQTVSQLVIIGEQTSIFLTERHDDRTGQGREIDHEFGREAVSHVVQYVGK